MELAKLKDTMPYQWRIQSWNKEKTSASCVAYIDARDVATMLDNVCGPENWQDEYKLVGTLLFAGVGIKIGADWIWKWDTGSESNIEKEKGHVSDSFKRAGVKWGIGRFLYDLPIQRVNGNGNGRVLDESGKDVWDVTEYINNRTRKPQTKAPASKVEQRPKPPVNISPDNTMPEKYRKQIMPYFTGKGREWRIDWVNHWLDRVKAKTRNIKSFNELPEAACAALLKELETNFHQGAA